MWGKLTSRLSLALLCIFSVATALAQLTAEIPNHRITFDQALALTLEQNPSLVAAGHQIHLASARVQQSALRPNTVLGIVLENFAGSGPFSELDATETTVSLAWIFERGKRERRVAHAEAGVSIADSEKEVLRLDVAANTARLFLRCVSFEQKLHQAAKAIALAESTLAVIIRRVAMGRSPTADSARAEAELARMHLDMEEYEHALSVAVHWLAAQWGENAPAFTSVSGSIDNLPHATSFETLLAQLVDTPDQLRYLNERRLREAELRLEQSKARPNWRISAGFRRLERTNDHALVAGLSIPLAISNKNQGNVAAARSKIALTDVNQSAALVRAQTHLYAIYQDLKHSLHEANALRDSIIPKLELALRETKRAYSKGRYGVYELSIARAGLLDAQNQRIDAAVQALQSFVEIERLTGISLQSSLAQDGEGQ